MIVFHLEEAAAAAGKTLTDIRRDKVVGAAALAKMKTGSGNFSIGTIVKLCEYLGCGFNDIMEIKREDRG